MFADGGLNRRPNRSGKSGTVRLRRRSTFTMHECANIVQPVLAKSVREECEQAGARSDAARWCGGHGRRPKLCSSHDKSAAMRMRQHGSALTLFDYYAPAPGLYADDTVLDAPIDIRLAAAEFKGNVTGRGHDVESSPIPPDARCDVTAGRHRRGDPRRARSDSAFVHR